MLAVAIARVMNRVGGLVELSGRNPRVRGISYGSRGRQLMQSTVVSRDMSCDYLLLLDGSYNKQFSQSCLSDALDDNHGVVW